MASSGVEGGRVSVTLKWEESSWLKLSTLCSYQGALIPLGTSCRCTRAVKYFTQRRAGNLKTRKATLGGRKGVRMVGHVMYWRSVTAGCVVPKLTWFLSI